MIKTEYIRELVLLQIRDTDLFLVDVEVKPGNIISVFLDKNDGITIEECAQINESLEHQLDRDFEDFELRVSSPGLNKPLKVMPQYEKNIGKQVDIVLNDGKKIRGVLKNANNTGIDIELKEKKKDVSEQTFSFDQIKSTKVAIAF
jgi:ribosome maturation factor RimP